MPSNTRKLDLDNPFEIENRVNEFDKPDTYQNAKLAAKTIGKKPFQAKADAIIRQHKNNRMTVWERINLLSDTTPTILYKNWGPHLDGANLVTAICKVDGREVAVYGHDFTIRAGSIDADNGTKLAKLFGMAGKLGIPVVGFNDSAGAFVPSGVGGLNGYAEAFRALRHISGIVPSIMCMVGFNAGGGSYLPRQGSFVIQPEGSFFGLTGPSVVQNVIGETVSAENLGGPSVHCSSGVTDFVVQDENKLIAKVRKLLAYIPSNNRHIISPLKSTDPNSRETIDSEILLSQTINSETGYNTPFDIAIIVRDLLDHGDFELFQPNRSANMLCAFGRLNGYVTGICANNSAIESGQIDFGASLKSSRFIRFCNLYNIPMIFIEDTTGFRPGTDQEHRGIVQAGRSMLDSIIDLRVPRFLLLVRNAYGGAYASFNNLYLGADMVFALPTARIAVMGSAGIEFVYKEELREYKRSTLSARSTHEKKIGNEKLRNKITELELRYEKEFLNANEALSLGSITEIIEPREIRKKLGENIVRYMKNYNPTPMSGVQREFH